MPTLEIGGGKAVSYDEYGAGPVVVLVHGSPGTARAWQRVAERLASRFRVIAPDLPGYGETTAGTAAAEVIEALGGTIGAPLVLAGHSYGGVVALRVALRDRLRARALALFEPVAVPFLRAIGDGEAFAAARAVFDDYIATFEAGDSQAVRKMADYWFGVGAFEQMPGPMKEYLVAHTAHNVSDVRATFREQYTAESLRALAVPVLVVCGAGSPEVTRKICAGISSQAPRGSLVTLEKANHAMPTTHADAVAALIADLAETAARSPARPDV